MASLSFYENDNPAENLAFGLTLHEAAHAQTSMEAVGATLSIIRQSWSGVRVVMDKACSFAGIRMISVHLPSEAEAYCINPAEILLYSTNEMMIYNAYFMMLPFMNVSNNNYEESFNRWITELKAIVGVPNDTDIRPVLTLERAADVRQVLGANIKLCRTLIKCFIDGRDVPTMYLILYLGL
ncbi:hypothetical protein V8G54_022657 [Vigna mungo]|uniref:Uncharacterized protein n=1 Tax=Vigna mungo TaxID=3915 RepID=A0AAQ3N3Q7_VIGMU